MMMLVFTFKGSLPRPHAPGGFYGVESHGGVGLDFHARDVGAVRAEGRDGPFSLEGVVFGAGLDVGIPQADLQDPR